MRAVQITRFGGPEVMDVVDLPDPTPGDGEQLFHISSSGVDPADTHHRLSSELPELSSWRTRHAHSATRQDPGGS
ncbi:hypothetical protein [Modestobacter altitudinis]|uniref:hypothetical protein n=1 Tax=Modestobacter altitudinis TaxID=2213158 RepID=UPI001FEC01B0|nr:hypothetical protein [Modestobacter altitudinis]